jgi:hypothetical protein
MKTPDYTMRAIKNYQDKYDLQQIRLEKGLKARAQAVGLRPSDMALLIKEEVEKREAVKN